MMIMRCETSHNRQREDTKTTTASDGTKKWQALSNMHTPLLANEIWLQEARGCERARSTIQWIQGWSYLCDPQRRMNGWEVEGETSHRKSKGSSFYQSCIFSVFLLFSRVILISSYTATHRQSETLFTVLPQCSTFMWLPFMVNSAEIVWLPILHSVGIIYQGKGKHDTRQARKSILFIHLLYHVKTLPRNVPKLTVPHT